MCLLLALVGVGLSQVTSKTGQDKAVSHLVEIQTKSHATTGWSDDPLGGSNDHVLAMLEGGS